MNEELEPSLKILIADDSNSDRLLLKGIIQNQGHIPLLASDGAEAIELFKHNHPDIILLDALMPNVDGFEAARYIKAHSGDNFYPIIFLTSLQEPDSLAKCLEVGGDDFLTKPYNSVILRAKLNAFRRMLKMHVELQHQRDQIADNNQRLIHEQEVAKRTFDKIAHEGSLHAHNVKYNLSPMAVFNGDVLIAAVRPNGNLTALLGDFTGHGLAAAIGAMPLSQTFYSMVAKGFATKDIVIELNRKLKEILPVGVFCCASMIDMDFRSKIIEIWNGGMPDNYLYRKHDHSIITIPSRHLALGILSPEKFSPNTDIYPMANGDRMYLWSDGIIESTNQDDDMFGDERLLNIFKANKNAEQLFDEINDTLEEFIGSAELADDLSIAEITMVDQLDFQQRNPKNNKPLAADLMDWGFSYVVRPISLKTTDPLPLLQKMLLDLPGLRIKSGELFTVLSELYSNALEHGVLGLESEIKITPQGFSTYYKERNLRLNALNDGFIRFEFDCKNTQEGMQLLLRVIDSGKGFDYKNYLISNAGRANYSGRGLLLINSICHSVDYFGEGNEVQVVFDWRTV
jgi:CheY-like chemotaxis protein/anti-sigma regulatory factor (Ser/Thr protein kinase)